MCKDKQKFEEVEYETVLGEKVKVKEPIKLFNNDEQSFLAFVTAITSIIVTFVMLLVAPTLLRMNEQVWVDEDGYIYSYAETTVPETVQIMQGDKLVAIANRQQLRYAENPNGENVIVHSEIMENAVTFPQIMILCTLVIGASVLSSFVVRGVLLQRKERHRQKQELKSNK